MIFNKKYIFISAAVLVVGGAVTYKIASRKNSGFQIAYTVAAQDVKNAVLATGSVTSNSNLDLSFKNSGVLKNLNVDVGAKVKKGQTLASLDERDASAAIRQAQGSVQAAQANYQKVINGASGPDIDIAKAAVETAQVNLNNAKSAYTSTESQQKVLVANAYSAMLNSGLTAQAAASNTSTAIVTITGAYTGAQTGAYNINISLGGSGVLIYSVTGLETDLGYISRGAPQRLGSKGLYVTFSSTGTINSGDSWTVSIPNTQASTYLANNNAYQASLQTQSAALASAQNAIDSAQAALDQANAALAQKTAAARPEDVAAAQAQITSAEAQLQTAQNQYSNNIITAPIDGVITSVDMQIGETIVPQKEVLKLLDQNSLHVESDIPESSIAQLQPGLPVDMTFDAFGDSKHYTGSVISIDPAATVQQGVINFRLLSSIPNDPEIKPGMTANLTIVLSEKQGVLAVPNRLIKTAGNSKIVSVLKNGKPEDVQIQTGLQGDVYTEVTSGLSAGDQIVSLSK